MIAENSTVYSSHKVALGTVSRQVKVEKNFAIFIAVGCHRPLNMAF